MWCGMGKRGEEKGNAGFTHILSSGKADNLRQVISFHSMLYKDNDEIIPPSTQRKTNRRKRKENPCP